MERLRAILRRIDGRGYKAYKDIAGLYRFATFDLSIDHVQGDPFAAPSRLSARVSIRRAGFPAAYFKTHIRRVALADFLTRQFAKMARKSIHDKKGSGKSGLIAIECGGQEILPRNSVVIGDTWIEVRFVVGLPAAGRRILGREAQEILLFNVPRIVQQTLFYSAIDPGSLEKHIKVAEDQESLRSQLKERGLVAFIADGSVLPRASGIDPRPLRDGAVLFEAPSSLSEELEAPNSGKVRGLGIPEGVTLIVGGGYHGKSTLLKSIEQGIYNHVPGDGREYVVSLPGAVKIRAEDGRSIVGVDISPFIRNLPGGRSTGFFCTPNASGSTSQAANIMEALEVNAEVLLVDEDTSATNFMIRDQRMQLLVQKDKEPITPFIDKVRLLYRDYGVSSVIVMGGSGDYLDVADTVILMDNYRPRDVTQEAKEVARRLPTERKCEGGGNFGDLPRRIPVAQSFDPRKGGKKYKIEARGTYQLLFGNEVVDLGALEQLVETAQTRTIGYLIKKWVESQQKEPQSLFAGLLDVFEDVEQNGLDTLLPFRAGNLALPRVFEVAAAINRFRGLKIKNRE